VRGGWDEVTDGNGLLATANDRITLLCLLGWIAPTVYADLRLLKSIRNRFAHHADVSNFEDGKIRSWVSALSSVAEAAAIAAAVETGVPIRTKFSTRQLFIMRSSLVVTALVTNLAIAPEARALRVAPDHVARTGWDLFPDNLKELKNIAADMILSVILEPQPESVSQPQA
jgi:hypothetical protein